MGSQMVGFDVDIRLSVAIDGDSACPWDFKPLGTVIFRIGAMDKALYRSSN